VRALDFLRCRRCATLWVVDPPASVDLYEGPEYFSNPQFGEGSYHGYRDYLSDREHIEAKFAEVLEHVERRTHPGRLLDVGAGPGLMLSAARDRGWAGVGLDLNPWAVDRAREQVGVEVHTGSLLDAGFDAASFDAVTMMDLLEHVAHPGELVEEAARVTRPGGALAVLTPDAGSPVSRAMGARWPELQRAPEHLVLFSVRGLAALLGRHGWRVAGWHPVGKTSSVETLVADVSPAAPAVGRALGRAASATGLAARTVELDPRTKFVMYANRTRPAAGAKPPRLPKRAPTERPQDAVLTDLRLLGAARELTEWMAERLIGSPGARVLEVGAGIGTFTRLLLGRGAGSVLALEPDPLIASVLEANFSNEDRVTVSRDSLPGAAALAAAGSVFDLVLCQNVLEHIVEDHAALGEMAAALRPGGRLALLVPAHQGLYGSLDLAYGHQRRYEPGELRAMIAAAGLVVDELAPFNLLGVAGWWASNRTGASAIRPASLRAYEALARAWRPLETRLQPPRGLSLIAHAHRPST
jgi:2-polyprenyl-3-methyl-5-hydroxy-6-metoxy-1,4-benzoquinol methylase